MTDLKRGLKHVLVLNRSFWPDSEATGQFITELCTRLADKYQITVISGRSYYIKEDNFKFFSLYKKEKLCKLNIFRVRHTRFWKGNLFGRVINWLTYIFVAFMLASKTKADLIIVATDPPFLGIAAMLLKKIKPIPFIYNCRDLYLDAAVGLGKLKSRGLIARVYDYFDRAAFNSALKVVPLGISMKKRLIAKGVSEDKLHVISDWVDTDIIKPVPKEQNYLLDKFGLKGKFVIMYSGNMGLTQSLDLILRAAAAFKDSSLVSFVFVGEGAAKESLKDLAASLLIKNILFLPYQPMNMLSYSLGMADLHIISFKKGLSGAIVPSKMYGIMAAARPYLIIGDEDCEPQIVARDFGCGLWVEAGDIGAIIKTIQWSYDHKSELVQMGINGRRVAEDKFAKDIVIREWFELLGDLSTDEKYTYR